MSERIGVTIADGVAAIVLDNPKTGNAIDLALARELMAAMHACEKRSDLRAITIKGSGRMFCAGGDLSAIHGMGDGASAYVRELLAYLHEAIFAIARIPVPVIAGVHGAAAGAGLALACSCDLTIATQSSRFLMAYAKVGLTPDGSSSWYLPRLIGMRRALELALTGRELTAAEAVEWSLINEAVPDGELDARLQNIAAAFCDGAAGALAGAKRLLRASLGQTLETQMMHEMEAICGALSGPEAREGIGAFLAKTKPDFRR